MKTEIKKIERKGLKVEHTSNGHYYVRNNINNKLGSFWIENDEIILPVAIYDNGADSAKRNINDLIKYLMR